MINPVRGIARRQSRSRAEHPHADLIAINVFDCQITPDTVRDELGFVISFERITEHKILSHEPIESGAVAVDNAFTHSSFICRKKAVQSQKVLSGCVLTECCFYDRSGGSQMHSNTVFFLRLVSATPTRYGVKTRLLSLPGPVACSLRCITGGGATMMKTDYFKRTLGGLILGLFFAGMFVMSSATAQAQQNDDWWNRNRRDNLVELTRIAIRIGAIVDGIATGATVDTAMVIRTSADHLICGRRL